jgi:hypothetical protein
MPSSTLSVIPSSSGRERASTSDSIPKPIDSLAWSLSSTPCGRDSAIFFSSSSTATSESAGITLTM